MNDFVGDYDTKDEAIKAIDEAHKENHPNDPDWYNSSWSHIWDIHTGIEVFTK